MFMSFMDAHPFLWILLILLTPIAAPGIWCAVECVLLHRAKKRQTIQTEEDAAKESARAAARHKTFAIIAACMAGVGFLAVTALIVVFVIAIGFM